MNKIQELINRLCPEGVEYNTLSEMCETLKKETLKTTELKGNGKYPVINSGRNFYGYYNKYNNTGNAITLAARGEYAGFVTYFENEFWAGGLCYPYRSKNEKKLITKFLYYYLKNKEKDIMEILVTRGSIPAINKTVTDSIKIAVPPIEVQSEIVRILDNFTLYSAEISAELKARKKQYQYYVEKLLNDVSNGNYIRLGDITKLITKGTTPKNFTTSGINYIKTEAFDGVNINKNKLSFVDEETHTTILKRSILEENDILFTISGATIGKLAIVNKEILPANTNQNLAIIRLKDNVNKEYIKYILQSSIMKEYMEKCVRGSAQPTLNLTQLSDLIFPFPSLEKQEEVLKLLEKIDKLVNSVIMGLPAEIEARQKQYEYYRDKLLDFKRLENK